MLNFSRIPSPVLLVLGEISGDFDNYYLHLPHCATLEFCKFSLAEYKLPILVLYCIKNDCLCFLTSFLLFEMSCWKIFKNCSVWREIKPGPILVYRSLWPVVVRLI